MSDPSPDPDRGYAERMARADALLEQGLAEQALDTYRDICARWPEQADPWLMQGALLGELGQADAARTCLDEALRRDPAHARASLVLGHLHAAAGRIAEAAACFERACAAAPDDPDARLALGMARMTQGRAQQALECFEAAVTAAPDLAEAHYQAGIACSRLGRTRDAIDALRRAAQRAPGDVRVLNDLGVLLAQAGEPRQALERLQAAVAADPGHAGARLNLGNVLKDAGRHEDAIASYRRALEIEPGSADAHYNLGVILAASGQTGDAITHYRAALDSEPGHARARANLGRILHDLGDTDEAIALYRSALDASPDMAGVRGNLLLAMCSSPTLSPRQVFDAHVEAGRLMQGPDAPPRPGARRRAGGRLRIGYVSPDFREHSVAHFIRPVLEAHDRGGFELFGYHCGPYQDDETRRLRERFDHWRDITTLSDPDACARIAGDGIDILVDLAGHTAGNRLSLFALRPAPVQVTWIGYPGTTGLAAMDYRITDAITDPEGVTDALHTERLIRLPGPFSCYAPPRDCPPPGPPPAIANGHVTFGSFNNLSKLNQAVIDTWARILASVPDARLTIKTRALEEPFVRERLAARFRARGVDPERLQLLGRDADRGIHLGRYRQVDIALDPFPYNGATTSCEALWMGVPVIALAGRTHIARVGMSQLTHLGHPELIAGDPDEYVSLAAGLAADRARLAALHAGLRDAMAASPLRDGPALTRALEAVFRRIARPDGHS